MNRSYCSRINILNLALPLAFGLIFSIHITSTVTAQSVSDSVVFFSDLKFNSKFERKTISEHFLQAIDDNHFKLFLCLSPEITDEEYQTLLNKYSSKVEGIKTEMMRQNKTQKKINVMYKKTYLEFFREYKSNINFSEIFTTGKYNCVSSSALFSLILSDLKIDYSIKEDPNHVYLVANPALEKIILQTTSLNQGVIEVKETFKQQYANQLLGAKIITEEEYNSTTLNDLFNKYYFTSKDIDIEELVGIQYSNNAISYIEQDNFDAALKQAEKAWMFYPCNRNTLLSMSILISMINNWDKYEANYSEVLSKLCRYNNYGFTTDNALYYFQFLIQKYGAHKSDYPKLEQAYNYLISTVKNEKITDDFKLIYNYEMGKRFFQAGETDSAIVYYTKAMEVDAENMELISQFTGCLGLHVSKNLKDYEEFNNIITSLEHYSSQFPSLHENQYFNTIFAGILMAKVGLAIDKKDFKNADTYFAAADAFMNAHKNIVLQEALLVPLFSLIATEYFRLGNKKKALFYVNKGLEYAPGNYELKKKQEALMH